MMWFIQISERFLTKTSRLLSCQWLIILFLVPIISLLISSYDSYPLMSTIGNCNIDQFDCNNGRCIPLKWVCDYKNDCDNEEDEHQSCPAPRCSSNKFACNQYIFNKTYCIPRHWRCDNVVDCYDGSDEGDSCSYRLCQSDDHICHDNGSQRCIPISKKCDGYNDCRDKSDETNCNYNSTSCYLNEFRCAYSMKCIDETRKCDYWNDCGDLDNSDEINCDFPPCIGNHFRCSNAFCIPMRWRCDGNADCDDSSDEQNCTSSVGMEDFSDVNYENENYLMSLVDSVYTLFDFISYLIKP